MAEQNPHFTTFINWSDIVEAMYPDILTHTHAVPPVNFNRVPYRRQIVPGTGLPALVLQDPLDIGHARPTQDLAPDRVQPMPAPPRNLWTLEPLRKRKRGPVSVLQTDITECTTQSQVIRNLQVLGESRREAMFIISQLNFIEYLHHPAYAAAVAQLPTIPLNPKTGRQLEGDFDVIVIHRQHGILIGEIKTVGRCLSSETDAVVDKCIQKALKQLDKSKSIMDHLVSDVASPHRLTVRTTLFLPYVSRVQLQRVLAANLQLTQAACRTLGAASAAEAAQLCCCTEQLSDPQRWWEVTPVLSELGVWWQGRMNAQDPHLTDSSYLEIVARFVGPATSITVHSSTGPRVQVKTMGQAVSELGRRLTTLVLTPEQVDIMQHSSVWPLIYLTGPPGTGKTMVLTLVGLCWLRQGEDVHVVSGWHGSRAASRLIKRQLETTLAADSTSPPGCGTVFLHDYDLHSEAEKDRAVRELSAFGHKLCVLMDELGGVGGLDRYSIECYVPYLVTELRCNITELRLWAAGIAHSVMPQFIDIPLRTPLRSAPAVVRFVEEGIANWGPRVHRYNDTRFPAAGDGLCVERLVHEVDGQHGHINNRPEDCYLCGQNVAVFLRRFGVGVPGGPINCRDVLILSHDVTSFWKNFPADTADIATADRDLIRGVRDSGLPVYLMASRLADKSRWEKELEELVTATSGEIIATSCDSVLGLERKVVVTVCDGLWCRLHAASRCTTQLIVLSTSTFTSCLTASSSLPKPRQQHQIHPYSRTGILAPGDELHVERLVHEGHGHNGHSGDQPMKCYRCGLNVAAVLRQLGVGIPGGSLSYGDVIILSNDMTGSTTTADRDLVRGVEDADLPVHMIVDYQADRATFERDSIIFASRNNVHDLEQKIVVVLEDDPRRSSKESLSSMARTTSHLVFVETV